MATTTKTQKPAQDRPTSLRPRRPSDATVRKTMEAPLHPLASDQREELAARLVAERRRLLHLYDQNLALESGVTFDEAEDMADRARKAEDREALFALGEEERHQLLLVEEALTRLAAGDYGTCLHCGQSIPVARLRAVPWARYCTEHQEQVERGLLDEWRPGGEPPHAVGRHSQE